MSAVDQDCKSVCILESCRRGSWGSDAQQAKRLGMAFYEAAKAFLMTPYAIAVHRFIIVGEKTTNYQIALVEPRFRRFFGWSLALSVLAYAPGGIS